MPEKFEGTTPPQQEGEQESKDDLRKFVELHEFPNRMMLYNEGVVDLDGKKIPTRIRLCYQGSDGVKVVDEKIYGEYMDDDGNTYWVKIGDANYGADRLHGYSKARLH